MASVGLWTRPVRCLAGTLQQHQESFHLFRRWLGSQAPHLLPGAEFTLTREFGPAEVAAFTAMTGDSNPIHSEQQQQQQPVGAEPRAAAVLPGMLSASLFPAIIGSSFPGALYLKQTLRFVSSAQVRLRCAGGPAIERPPVPALSPVTRRRRPLAGWGAAHGHGDGAAGQRAAGQLPHSLPEG